ncbi:hypothetical protein [Paenibacillus thalictri]|uniref:DUF1080 domain-containing protein n=1 Tax=Paenibacillus thalictri TaxID=2527873 RepID=A0A4Q9DSG8_9BACL|nr:hypothetical protein [Paenibacillus thalictri]TBL78199.1 hypothetical protein EYB31_15070 [Paenibacillus thalictri]
MSVLFNSLHGDLSRLSLGESGAIPGEWKGRGALYFENNDLAAPVLLLDEMNAESYRLQIEMACPGPYGFVGLVFGARDAQNFELVYVSPGTDDEPGEIQYDPIMNGSSTWQIYNGPRYQAPAPMPSGEWTQLAVEVKGRSAAVYVGDSSSPQLFIPNLLHGPCTGKVGVWGYLPSYVRHLTVEDTGSALTLEAPDDLSRLMSETYVTEWLVSGPYPYGTAIPADMSWTKAAVEENGTLNINRLFPADRDVTIQVRSTFSISEDQETMLSFGFSDELRLYMNEQEVYQGEWKWAPPESDGRIRPDHIKLPVSWKAGIYTIRAELTSREGMFGWGLGVRTGLTDISWHSEEQ